MSVTVHWYRFDKYLNSTALPSGQAEYTDFGTTDCALKKPTSMTEPTLLLSISDTSAVPTTANYCHIEEFGRYYFVSQWTSIRDVHWEAQLRVDVGGTYRQDILATTQFVERAQNKRNTLIADRLCVGTADYTQESITTDVLWWGLPNDMTYIVEIMGSGQSVYYNMDAGQLATFFAALFSDAYPNSIMPDWQQLSPDLKFNLNPLQYIGSIRAFPLAPPGVPSGDIPVGWGYVGVNGHVMLTDKDSWTQTFSFPHHPDSASYPWTDYEPYTVYGLYLPYFGDFPIDAAAARAGVTADVQISIKTGTAKCVLRSGGRVVGSADALYAANIAISTANAPGYGLSNIVADTASIVGAAATGNIGGVISALTGTIQDMTNAHTPKLSSAGGNNAIVEPQSKAIAYARCQQLWYPPTAAVGQPYYTADKLSNLAPGLVKCINALVPFGRTDREREEIVTMLNGGIYIV